MQAGSDSCHCVECGVVCKGRFEACPSVWALGPQILLAPAPPKDQFLIPQSVSNGAGAHEPERPPAVASDRPAAVTENLVGRVPVGGPLAGAAPVATQAPAAPPAAGPAPAVAADGAQAFRWFQNAFDTLRLEVQGLRGALSQEQALVATLLESRSSDAVLDADSLRIVVDTAARKALRRQAADLKTDVAAVIEDLRRDLEAVKVAQEESVAGLQTAIAAAAAAAANAGLPAELSRRDAANRKAFRVTLHEELQPLLEVVAESVAQSEYELQSLNRRLDKLDESGSSLSAALAEVTASVVALTADGPAPSPAEADAEADAEIPPVRSPLLERARGVDAAAIARRATTRSGPAGPRRPSPERSGVGPVGPDATGRRVSLRRPPPEG